MTSEASDAFWSFSLKLYEAPGVADSLIDLQDSYGADVNILLMCCWCGASGRLPLDSQFLQEAISRTSTWQKKVVQDLRALRRVMKTGIAGIPMEASTEVREEVKRLEIACERVEQDVLANLVRDETHPGERASIRGGITTYFSLLGVDCGPDIEAVIELLVEACDNLTE